MTEKPKPRRRWFRFSLTTLLIVVLVLSLPLGWLAMKMVRAERQRKAVEAIAKTGGYVFYDFECRNGIPIYYEEPPAPAPAWLLKRLGVDFFADVVQAHFAYVSRIGDADLQHIRSLTSLHELGLNNTLVTDAGLVHLKGLTRLERLELSETQIAGDGLQHLTGLESLEDLDLSYTNLDDNGLRHLWTLTELDYLDLHGTLVTEKGVEQTRMALPNCEIRWEPRN